MKVPAEAPIELDDDAAARLLPRRGPRSHKGTHGTLLLLSGSLDYAGAALLACAAGARAGAGLVVLAVPASLQPVVAGRFMEAVTLALPERSAGDVDPAAAARLVHERHADAMACGSGWGDTPGNAELLQLLLRRPARDPDGADRGLPPPIVVDGTALNILARGGDWWSGATSECVLTPHPGEFTRLSGRPAGDADDERLERATDLAARCGQVVVLKGARTVIAAPDGRCAVAPFQNPAMATAGTGDVLAGTIGGLMAQAMGAFDAACLGVYLHGAAGEAVRRRLGDAGMIASDLLSEIPVARAALAERR